MQHNVDYTRVCIFVPPELRWKFVAIAAGRIDDRAYDPRVEGCARSFFSRAKRDWWRNESGESCAARCVVVHFSEESWEVAGISLSSFIL